MGVTHLNTFMNNAHPTSICSTVDIATLALQHKASTGHVPRLVVDGNNVMYVIYSKHKHDWLMGGQLRDCVAEIKTFIDAFLGIGVELIFFFDGATSRANRDKWVARRTPRVKSTMKLYDLLKAVESRNGRDWLQRSGESPESLAWLAVQPSLIGATSRFMVKYACGDSVQLRVSQGDCDQEIAAFAQQNHCMGILSGDTDFVILGQGRYLSIHHLDLSTMTTRLYDGHRLAEHFSLSFEHLPLLASLLGGDILPATSLDDYHQRLTGVKLRFNDRMRGITPDRRFRAVADVVRTTPTDRQALLDKLPHIAQTQLRDTKLLELLRQSVLYYMMATDRDNDELTAPVVTSEQWQSILEVMLRKHVQAEVPPQMRNILLGKQFEATTSLEDLTSHDLPSSAAAYKRLRRRIYGILLHEKPGVNQPPDVEEWCVYNTQSLTIDHVQAIPVHASTHHPGLLALWTDSTSPSIETQRWKLFLNTVSHHLDTALMKQLLPRHLVPTCVLFYMQHHATGTPLLVDWELDAFLVTAVEVEDVDIDTLHELSADKTLPPPRAVDCSNLFARGVSTIHEILAACGYQLEAFMPWHFYDGKLFLANYLKLRDLKMQFSINHHHSRSQAQQFELMKQICHK